MSKMEGEETDHPIELMVDAIKPFLTRHIKVSDILPFLTFIVKDSENRLRKLDQDGHHTEAMESLLQCLKADQSEPGRYAAFRDALSQAGYDHVVSVLQGRDIEENHNEYCELLKLFKYPISEKIDPRLLMRYLRPHDLVTSSDESVVRSCQSYFSREHAVFKLLDLVPRRKRNWYDLLMSAMFECYPDIVGLIDPELQQKKVSQLGMKDDPDLDEEMEVVEHTISVTEPGRCSDGLLASVDSLGKRSGDANSDLQASSAKKLKISESSGKDCAVTVLEEAERERLFTDIKKSFVTRVDPRQLITYLKIGQVNEETIIETYNNKGRQLAAQDLLHIVYKNSRWWIDDLCLALRSPDIAQEDLADEIEEKRQIILDDRVPLCPETQGNPHDAVETDSPRTTSPRDGEDFTPRPLGNNLDGSTVQLQNETHKPSTSQSSMNILEKDDLEKFKQIPLSPDSNNVNSLSHDQQGEADGNNPDFNSAESSQTEHKTLNLRSYQSELAEDALAGHNCIICAPTGSGKTLVAVKIMQEHLAKRGIRKIAFFANQNVLVDQQYARIREYMGSDWEVERVSSNNAETMKTPLRLLIEKKHILVMTPQILEDALKSGEVPGISEFTLLVFDECHHTNQRHVFNRLMFRYMDIKLDKTIPEEKKCLPQIVGLTASVGVGGAKDIKGTLNHVKTLCANLNASGGVSMVQKYKEDMANYTSTADLEFQETEERKNDIFKTVVSDKLMRSIEESMARSNYASSVTEVENFAGKLKAPPERGEQHYQSWLSDLFRAAMQIRDPDARRFFVAHRSHLEIYHKCLAMNADCRTKDALDKLNEDMSSLPSFNHMDATDRKLMKLYEDSKQELQDASANPLCNNPKLVALKDKILEQFHGNQNCRVMVFVGTKDLASALLKWMKDDQDLSGLGPAICVGQGASASKGGMTRHEQNQSVKLFRKGEHKVLIATSIAEEGVDFSECNQVIQYQYTTNEKAMVQARGRARAENSGFLLITGRGNKKVLDKGELNLAREWMMKCALEQLYKESRTDRQKFLADIEAIQLSAKMARDREAKSVNARVLRDEEFALRCVKCDTLACFSTDLRKVEKTHHVVLPKEFQDKIKVKPHPKGRVDLVTLQIASKIFCKECGYDWGVAIIYNDATLPVLKINSFRIVDAQDRVSLAKKWNKAPFAVGEITQEELVEFSSLELP